MYKVIKQKLVNGKIVDDCILIVGSETKAKETVRAIREKEQNQLCYYQKV